MSDILDDNRDGDDKIIINDELNIWEALIPVIILIALLAYNIFGAGGELLGEYSNHYILLFGGLIASFVGFYNKVDFWAMFMEVWANLKSVFTPILILLLVGALAGTWLISGIIPTMIYYGLDILGPSIFLPATVVIAAIISLATGSSWTTSATVGIALVGIGDAIGIPSGMTAGAVISGAYFGDKMSPLSDTTNLAPAMAGTDLFTHIRYMAFTTVPSIIITILAFIGISYTLDTSGSTDVSTLQKSLEASFNISPFLFLVPMVVVILILAKIKPIASLAAGVLLAAVFAFIFQPDVLTGLMDGASSFGDKIMAIVGAIFTDTTIASDNAAIADLLTAGGMIGMKWTVLLVISAMTFGGVMEAIGALSRISSALLSLSDSIFGLFASTVGSCLALNITASDQYLAIVIPGKMFAKAYEDRGLAPENLSRTLEDSGTVTSVLIPWNTCGAYQSGVLGVGVGEYAIFAIFNWLSPIMTLIFAGIGIKIKMLGEKSE